MALPGSPPGRSASSADLAVIGVLSKLRIQGRGVPLKEPKVPHDQRPQHWEKKDHWLTLMRRNEPGEFLQNRYLLRARLRVLFFSANLLLGNAKPDPRRRRDPRSPVVRRRAAPVGQRRRPVGSPLVRAIRVPVGKVARGGPGSGVGVGWLC
jgi:hypothetical protein